jgi:hypothetical protein
MSATGRRVYRTITGATALALALTLMPAATGQVEVLALPATATEQVVVPLPTTAARAQASGGEVATHSEIIDAPIPFSMVGFELPEGVDEVRVRTSIDGDEWTAWTTTERLDELDGPDAGTSEAEGDRSHRYSEPVWVEEARHLQVALPDGQAPTAGTLRAELIDSMGHSGGPVERKVVTTPTAQAEAQDAPHVISRREWGADESLARRTSTARDVHFGVVHHTATANTYTDARAVMRSMYHYHTVQLGWADLGYNVVVDQQGNVYEGRAGGLTSGVIGAHAVGYNTGSFGVSVIGNYDVMRLPQAALDAVTDVIGWQSRVHGIDPEGWTTTASGASIRTIIGHRDVGSTACPGRYFHPLLGDIRARAAAGASAGMPAPPPAPTTTISAGPDGPTDQREATLHFAASGNVSFYECRWQGGAWYACASPRTFTGLADGEQDFQVRAVAPDGTREANPARRRWTVEDPTPSPAGRFSDVAGSAHAAGIAAVATAGITEGFRDGTFRPRTPVTREQMATFLTRALDLPDGDEAL